MENCHDFDQDSERPADTHDFNEMYLAWCRFKVDESEFWSEIRSSLPRQEPELMSRAEFYEFASMMKADARECWINELSGGFLASERKKRKRYRERAEQWENHGVPPELQREVDYYLHEFREMIGEIVEKMDRQKPKA